MLTQLPLSAIPALFGAVILSASWVYMYRRIKADAGNVQRSVRLMQNFFLFNALFFATILVPYYWLLTSPGDFPLVMAWAYVIGHVFLYLAFANVAMMVCNLIPRLNKLERFVMPVFTVVIVGITLFNAKTMIWGVRPFFDYQHNITQPRAAAAVGITIALSVLISTLPAVALFVRNGIKSHGPARLRSFILAAGFLMLIIAGPVHDLAKTGEVYALADVVTIVALITIGTGVMYRFEEKLVPAPPAPRVLTPSSNTV
jgi:hypothetical protein